MKLKEYLKYDENEYRHIIVKEHCISFLNYNYHDGSVNYQYSDIIIENDIEDYEEIKEKYLKIIEENEEMERNTKEEERNF